MRRLSPVVVDFEAATPAGEAPRPVCIAYDQLDARHADDMWLWDTPGPVQPPFPLTPETMLVAYGATMEVRCFLARGWELPAFVLDLHAEFRRITNGTRVQGTNSLLDACAVYGIKHAFSEKEKESLQALAGNGGPFIDPGRMRAYCAEDTRVAAELYRAMLPDLNLDRALVRGEYVKAVGRIEARGVPIDMDLRAALVAQWSTVQDQLAFEAGLKYARCFNGKSFSEYGFEWWLGRRGIWWPRTATGRLKTDAETFDEMTRFFPELQLMKHTRGILSELRTSRLEVGRDGRSRASTGTFAAKTARNGSSTSRAIFGGPTWLRSLIRPEPGKPVAYIDFEQQEFGIAAALSDDPAMIASYTSGDAYMAFAIACGAAPVGATKATHEATREIYKTTIIATQYGQSASGLGQRLSVQTIYAAGLLAQHRATYPSYWAWSDCVSATFRLTGRLRTALGWQIRVSELSDRELSIRNWPIQTCGAEILMVAVILATQAGVKIVALVHDAILIESTDDRIDRDVELAREAMQVAGEIVLDGFVLRTEAKVIRYPDRYVDKRGVETWSVIRKVLGV